MHIVVPFGFYGSGNIGDEATLHGFARLLAAGGLKARVSVGSRNPAHTARVEPSFRYFSCMGRDPRRWFAKWMSSAHAMVGGTPIMDVLGEWPLSELTPLVHAAERWKSSVTFVGVGTEPLRLERSRRIVAEEIAPRTRHWSVRCMRDRDRLVEYGVAPNAITVAADMAWLIEAATAEFGKECLRKWGATSGHPLIGVNLVNENCLFDRHPEMVDAVAMALDELIQRMSARVIFLSNEVREDSTFDKAAAEQIVRRMKHPECALIAPNEYFSPRQMMSIISCCYLTISMRYHFCLFSALQNVPFIAIQRSGKVSDLCWDIGWQAGVVPPQIEAEELIEHGLQLYREASLMKGQLQATVGKMRERVLYNTVALNALGLRAA